MAVSPGTRLGAYEILTLLGSGGMGEVYRARDTKLNREIAIKVLPASLATDPERLARFSREAQMLAALNHPNIAHIHGLEDSMGVPALVMELVEGPTLADRIAKEPIPVDEAVAIAMQIAEALEAAHEQHIIHRDLKPANVKITPAGTVKVLDFGLAKQVSQLADSKGPTMSGLSNAGLVVGTVAYMSPEQALGQMVDHRSDLFSLGVVLYEMLTGRAPFVGATSVAVVDAILHETPQAMPRFNPSVPDGLVRIVTKLLEKNRDERYLSARDVYNDLRRVQRDRGAPSTTAPPVAQSRRSVLPLVSLVLFVGVAASAWWSVRGRPSTNGAPSIVVLPAEISGPQSTAQFDYLRDAVPATLSTRLAEIDGLETKVPPTNLEWESAKRNVQNIVHAYNVTFYLSPHVYSEPNRLAMTLQLVQSDNRKMIWSHDYDGTPGAYQALIGQAADDLRIVLRPGSPKSPARATSSEAELAYQEGNYAWDRFNNLHKPEDLTRAETALKRALALDPSMADAAAELAFLYEFRFEGGAPIEKMLPEMDRWTREALRIDPHCGLALVAVADSEFLKPAPDMPIMIHNAVKGAFYAPRRPIAHNLLGIAMSRATATLSLEAMRHATRLDPLYRAVLNNIAGALFGLNRSADAVAFVDEAIGRQAAPSLVFSKLPALFDLGRIVEAEAVIKTLPTPPAGSLFTIADDFLLLDARRDPAADQKVALLIELLSKPDLSNYTFSISASRLLPFLGKSGRVDAAMRLLQAGTAHGWLPAYDTLSTDARLVSLRGDPRFAPFQRESRARIDAMIAVLEDTRQNGELPDYLVPALQDLRAKLEGWR